MALSELDAAILDAARNGNIAGLQQYLLDPAGNPNVKDEDGSTPLHYAVKGGFHGTVELLLKFRADPSLPDATGHQALHYAVESERDDIVELLINAGREQEDVAMMLGPKYPIKVNGNMVEEQSIRTVEATTQYVLIQALKRFTPSQKKDLGNLEVGVLEYIPKNAYLCTYAGGNLDRIRQLEFVVFVDIYRQYLKIPPELQHAQMDPQHHNIDVVFHKNVDPKNFYRRVYHMSEMTGNLEDVQVCTDKVRLSARGIYIRSISDIDEVRNIEEVQIATLRNDWATRLISADINSQVKAGLSHQYQGSGQIIAVADTGIDTSHPAFIGRIRTVQHFPGAAPDDTHGHDTHVCGSAAGNGIATWQPNKPPIRGAAPEGVLVVQAMAHSATTGFSLPTALDDLFGPAYINEGARVHSNSWGASLPNTQMRYTQRSKEIDRFVWQNPDMVICWAAGNQNPPSAGQTKPVNTPLIGAEAAAKNYITIGASESNRHGASSDDVATFSSRGPTAEDRIKPDVVAPGTSILSARSANSLKPPCPQLDSHWSFEEGTSMATPLVAGCAAMLREALITQSGYQSPNAALIKALLNHGADLLSDQRESGFGRVNLVSSIDIVHQSIPSGFGEDQVSDNDPVVSYKFVIGPGNSTLKTTLVWSDPPGDAIGNSLLLTVRVFDGTSETEREGDENNNVQQIVWESVPSGDATITVESHGLVEPTQPFAFVWNLS
ncbi:hypothetical protein CKAH01_06450 [Colletotrichum kahawae]|uniref:Peptidase S8/S53 domain-containing protein n=1 Tax=Colletotrichum kahawae TaxID=34407 RepID=A0AAE0D5M4_COLKA|nr:hypothetical protein CKAH01_06450 [Colletotrichum kahawae]